MRKTRMEKGITLIALIITIVVLLILAVVTINSIKNDGILSYAGNAANNYNESVKNEQGLLGKYEEYLKDHSGSGNNAVSGEWTQSGTSVTNGAVTLNVGQTVTGYTSPEGTTDPGWAVLGAENGRLLLVSKTNVKTTVSWDNKEDYNNELAKLNENCYPYLNSNLADKARSINVADINRVTGYDPTNQKDGTIYGAGTISQYGNTVTYTMSGDYVAYSSDKVEGSNGNGTSSINSFEHIDGRKLGITDDSIKVTNNSYEYTASAYLTDTTSDAYNVLFASAKLSGDWYWLATSFEKASGGYAEFGCFQVGVGSVGPDLTYWYSWGMSGSGHAAGIRAVVVLKSGIDISESGVISHE